MQTACKISEINTDVQLLLESLKYHIDNPHAVKQALLTLVSIFNGSESSVKDYFRTSGGLQFVLSLLTSTTNTEVKEVALYCLGCAVENNVYSQKSLITDTVFRFLHSVLSTDIVTTRLKQTASFFLISLVSNNGLGQSLTKKSQCLNDLLKVLKTSLPCHVNSNILEKESWFEDAGSTSLELWSSVTSALCICINNPQNEENQKICGLDLPYMFSVMLQHTRPDVLNPLLSLVGFIVANNVKNQDRVRQCGGLQVLCSRLHKSLNTAQCHVQLCVHIINTLDSCISDNKENAEEMSNLHIVEDLMKVLAIKDLEIYEKLKVLVTLGHSVEMSGKIREELIKEHGGLECLIQLLTVTDDEEFCRTVKYVLQLCVEQDDGQEKDVKRKNNANDSKREEGMLLLKKINEISERLQCMEDEAAQNYKAMNDMMNSAPQQNYITTNNISTGLSKKYGAMLDRNFATPLHNFNADMLSPGPLNYCKSQNPLQNNCNLSSYPVHNGDQYTLQNPWRKLTVPCSSSYYERESPNNNCLQNLTNTECDHPNYCEDANALLYYQNLIGSDIHTPISQISNKGDATPGCPLKLKGFNQLETSSSGHCLISNSDNGVIIDKHSKRQLFDEGLEIYPVETNHVQSVESNSVGIIEKGRDSSKDDDSLQRTMSTSKIVSKLTPKSRGKQMVLLANSKQEDKSHDISISSNEANSSFVVHADNSVRSKNIQLNEENACSKTKDNVETTPAMSSVLSKNKNMSKELCQNKEQQDANSCEEFKKPTKTAPKRKLRSFAIRRTRPLGMNSKWNNGKRFDIYSDAVSDLESICSEAPSEFDCGLILGAGQCGTPGKMYRSTSVTPVSITPRVPLANLHGNARRQSPLIQNSQHLNTPSRCVKPVSYCSSSSSNLMPPECESKENFTDPCILTDSEDNMDRSSENSFSSVASSYKNSTGKSKDCVGCSGAVTVGDTRLNSRTLNILLETCPYTCQVHRDFRNLERGYISELRKNRLQNQTGRSYLKHSSSLGTVVLHKSDEDVFEISSDTEKPVSPPQSVAQRLPKSQKLNRQPRKERVPYTEEEVQNLITGVQTLGKFWAQILNTYNFHPTRTAEHLKDKFRQMEKQDGKVEKPKARVMKPFSMCEERRLLKGVKAFGYNWKTILHTYKFAKGRTNEDLRNKWRCMNKQQYL